MSYQLVHGLTNGAITEVLMGKQAVKDGVNTRTRTDLKVIYDKDNTGVAANADIALVQRAQAGDLDAFHVLYERYERRIYSAAYSLSGNRADAEDIVQEAFLKAFKRIESFKGQSSFYTWLYRIVSNYAIDYSRKRYRKKERPMGQSSYSDNGLSLSDENSSGSIGSVPLFAKRSAPEDVMFRLEIRDRIQEAISSLSPVHRAVIVMREIDGLSYDEISDSIGCSKGTVMSRLFHARQKLQAMLRPLLKIANSGDESDQIKGSEG